MQETHFSTHPGSHNAPAPHTSHTTHTPSPPADDSAISQEDIDAWQAVLDNCKPSAPDDYNEEEDITLSWSADYIKPPLPGNDDGKIKMTIITPEQWKADVIKKPDSYSNTDNAKTPKQVMPKREGEDSIGLFKVMTADKYMLEAHNRPMPQMLFGEFWFESELCILFADTNLGKSILAVQIANSISKGVPIQPFKADAPAQKVLYLDFEMSDKQFEGRYTQDYEQGYPFGDNFIRVEINPDAEIPENMYFEDYLNKSLEATLIDTGAKVVIIDNLTYLKHETEKAKDALPLMKELKALKSKYNLSILALAHTPKRDSSKPITGNDLQGSKMLLNFCDSAFAMGASNEDKQLRYLKQIKQRNTEQIYDADNICLCHIIKPFNFLHFEFISFGTERDHLRAMTDNDRDGRIAAALELKKQGVSNLQIAKQFGVSEGAVRKWVKAANENASW